MPKGGDSIDKAHTQTEKILQSVERRVNRLYQQARREIRELEPMVEEIWLEDEDATQRQRLNHAEDNGLTELVAAVVAILILTNGKAFKAINDTLYGVYTLNYELIEDYVYRGTGTRLKDVSAPAVDKLLSRFDRRAYKQAVDSKYVSKEVMDAIKTGVRRGESIPNIQKRIQNTANYSRNRATTTARTETTRIQNEARLNAMREAKKAGISIKKKWIATHDSRTRDSHAWVDGEIVDIEDAFSNGLIEPGDRNAPAAETVNCRCTMREIIEV